MYKSILSKQKHNFTVSLNIERQHSAYQNKIMINYLQYFKIIKLECTQSVSLLKEALIIFVTYVKQWRFKSSHLAKLESMLIFISIVTLRIYSAYSDQKAAIRFCYIITFKMFNVKTGEHIFQFSLWRILILPTWQ